MATPPLRFQHEIEITEENLDNMENAIDSRSFDAYFKESYLTLEEIFLIKTFLRNSFQSCRNAIAEMNKPKEEVKEDNNGEQE